MVGYQNAVIRIHPEVTSGNGVYIYIFFFKTLNESTNLYFLFSCKPGQFWDCINGGYIKRINPTNEIKHIKTSSSQPSSQTAFFPRYQRHRLSNATSDHGSNSAHLRPALKRGFCHAKMFCSRFDASVNCLQLGACFFGGKTSKKLGHFSDWANGRIQESVLVEKDILITFSKVSSHFFFDISSM